MRKCSNCRQTKSLDEFYRRSDYDAPQAWCKECTRAYNKERKLLVQYGVTRDDLISLGEICRICGLTTNRMVVDHDHRTGEVRGRLCTQCNTGIGMLRDDPDLLRKAIEYLEDENGRGMVTTTGDNPKRIQHTSGTAPFNN